jgi:hypothetical protein
MAPRQTPTDLPATETYTGGEDTHLDVHQAVGGVSVA